MLVLQLKYVSPSHKSFRNLVRLSGQPAFFCVSFFNDADGLSSLRFAMHIWPTFLFAVTSHRTERKCTRLLGWGQCHRIALKGTSGREVDGCKKTYGIWGIGWLEVRISPANPSGIPPWILWNFLQEFCRNSSRKSPRTPPGTLQEFSQDFSGNFPKIPPETLQYFF